MSWTNNGATPRKNKFNPKNEVKNTQKFKCFECGRLWPFAFRIKNKFFCTGTCWMTHFPMTLTGDETKLNQIAADLAENRCSGRGGKKKA
jgi:hypothetical protein